MMTGNIRKKVKARRRAITKFVNTAAATSPTYGKNDGNVMTNGGSTGCCSVGKYLLDMKESTTTNPSQRFKTAKSCETIAVACRWKSNVNGDYSEDKLRLPTCRKTSSLVEEPAATTTRYGNCVVCGVSSTSICSACCKVFYCGKAHQKQHWIEGHKLACFPCEEMTLEEQKGVMGPLGRGPYMKASKDLRPMEKIYEDRPLMSGPGCCGDLEYEPICLGCTNPVKDTQKCTDCNWPLCGLNCGKNTLHGKYECEIFTKNSVQELKDPFQYELVRILRCLLTKYKAPDIFERLMKLEAALQFRKTLDCLIEATKTVSIFVRENCRLVDFDDDTIEKICGVVDLQTQPTGKFRTTMQIFQFPTKLMHDCNANTRVIEILRPNGENLIRVVAARPIKKGEPITQRLLVSLEPTYQRQRFLADNYYFQCYCKLCIDPTENGSYFSAVKCPTCFKNAELRQSCEAHKNLHYLLPLSPPNLNSPWACSYCKREFSGAEMLEKFNEYDDEYWKFKYEIVMKVKEEDKIIKALRKKIEEFESQFHPNNYFIWKLKQLLFNKLTEHILMMMPPATWKEFREKFSEVVELSCCVMTTVEAMQSGLTLIRGRSLHDLIAAYWAYIQWAVLYGKAASFKNHCDSKEFYKLIEETIRIFEPEITDVRKVTDSVIFMRDHVHEVQMRVQKLRRVNKMEKSHVNSEEKSKK